MTDELIRKLRPADGLEVRALDTVRQYTDQDAIEAGRNLRVDAVVDGRTQIADGRLRASVKLIRVSDSVSLLDQDFDEQFTGILAVQESIAELVASAINVKLGENAKKRYTDNLEAYEQYREGRFTLGPIAPNILTKALRHFERAVEIDPNYALAFTGITDCYRSLILSAESQPDPLDKVAIDKAEQAARIDPQLAEVQSNLGAVYFWFQRDWAKSQAAFERALELDPNSALIRINYAHLLSNIGRHEEAIIQAEHARKIDPIWAYSSMVQGLVFHQAGKPDDAAERYTEAIKLDPKIWLAYAFLAVLQIESGEYEQAIASADAALERNPHQSFSNAYKAVALARKGNRDEAKRILDGLIAKSEQPYAPPYHVAIAYMGLGERENAILWLEKSLAARDPKIVFLKSDNIWDDVRSEPRFIELMKRMNLTP